MALEIIWSEEASKQLEAVYDYLESSWENQAIRNFSRRLEFKLKLIASRPQLFKASARLEGTRECLVSKHNTIFYIYDEAYVYIVSFWDNRQNPSTLHT